MFYAKFSQGIHSDGSQTCQTLLELPHRRRQRKIADWSFQASVEEEENGGKVIFCLTFVVLESEATL